MKPTLLLRVASVLTLLFAVGHTSGALGCWSPAGETAVLGAMREFYFDAGGVRRSYLDFYLGFGFIISVYLVLQAAALWQLSNIAAIAPRSIRPLIGSFLLAMLLITALSWRFIFMLPVACCAAVAICLALAYVGAGKSAAGGPVSA